METKNPLVEEAPGLPGEERATVSAGAVPGFDGWGRIVPNPSAPTLAPGISPAFTVFAGSTGNGNIEPQVWQPTRLSGDLLETPESASASDTPTPTAGLERPIPAPLDLTAVAGPAPLKKWSLPDPKPVVLNSAALDNLRRLGGPSSSVSSFESRGSGAPGMVLVGRDMARGGGGDGSGSKGMGAGAPGGEVVGDALRRGTTAVAAPAVGRTFQVNIYSIAPAGSTLTHLDGIRRSFCVNGVDSCRYLFASCVLLRNYLVHVSVEFGILLDLVR